jgi:hypothetical protein
MKDAVTDIFNRVLIPLTSGKHGCLRAEQINPVEHSQLLKTPIGTTLIVGVDGKSREPLATLAITSPALSPDSPALLAFAARQAQTQKAPYFITWTLREAILWKTPKPGVPAEQGCLEKLRDYGDTYGVVHDGDVAEFEEPILLSIVGTGKRIIADVERLFKVQALQLVRIEATYFVQRLLDAVHDLLPMVTDSLHMRLETDLTLRRKIIEWALMQGIAGTYKDRDFALALARQIIYRLLGKIIFFQSLRRAARQLPQLDLTGIDPSLVLPTLRRAFAEALKVDYHAVFSEELPDTVSWPGEAAKLLAALIHDFNTRDFSSLPQDVIGTVFERLIPPEDRHLLGQYFTPELLCDLGIAFSVPDPRALVIDMTCGTGTFLIRAYDRKFHLGNRDHAALLSELWGIDIAAFPAELAVINLFRQNLTAPGNFPRIACRDLFTLRPGDALPFPPPKMNLALPEQVNEPIPRFDAIVGNFPYKGADQIEKTDAHYLEFLRQILVEGWFEKYPQLFCCPTKKEQAELEQAILAGKHLSCKRDRLKLRISSYADLYVYLYFHAARFLKTGGRMAIITSNAWLDVNYGYELQRFFCDNFKLIAVMESRCEPWFTEASVNTVYTIVERCADSKERDQHLVKFVRVKKRLADLMPHDPQLKAADHWQGLSRLVDRIEVAGREHSKKIHIDLVTEEDEDFRIRVCRQGELREELEQEKKTVKWGQYLRAPQVYFDLFKKGHFCLLRDLAVPKRGGTTRINEFYYVTTEVAKQFGIEEEYLLPLIKSPKDSARIPITPGEIELRVFVCRRSKTELERMGHNGALKYIEWGETQTYGRGEFRGLPWPKGTWVGKREPGWYALPNAETSIGQVFFGQTFGDRHVHRFSGIKLIPDCRLYYLEPGDNLTNEVLAALLNSSLLALACEVVGRVTLGDGVLELKVEDARDYLPVPDLRKTTAVQKAGISAAFEKLKQREIDSVFEEVKQKDRQALDTAILEAIGLDPKEYLEPIYTALCELVRERIDLGRMRGKMRKTKTRKVMAEKEAFQQVLDEVIPDGPKRFPEDFLSTEAAKSDRAEMALPERPLRVCVSPMYTTIYEGTSVFKQLKYPAEGKFIVYCQKAGQPVAAIPSKPVEVTRTVANYESYIRSLHEALYDAFYRRTLDVNVSKRLTQVVLDRYNLSIVDAS